MANVDLVSCCDASLLDLSKMEIPFVSIHFWKPSLWIAMLWIMFHPFYCRMVARWESRTRKLSTLFGSSYVAFLASSLAAIILGFLRNMSYLTAMRVQDRSYLLQQNSFLWLGYFLLFLGSLTVVFTLATVGITGVYFGEYFKLEVPRPDRTWFPYNTFDFPIHWAAIMNFVGIALVRSSEAGLLLSVLCAASYILAIKWERPFRSQMLRERQLHDHCD